MSIFYKKICSLRILHNYYIQGYGDDFLVVPLPQTVKLARQYKLRFVKTDQGLDILSQMLDDTTSRIDLGDKNKLSFALVLKHQRFLNYTALPKKENPNQIYQIENNPAYGNTLTHKEWEKVTPKPRAFQYKKTSHANAVSLEIADPYSVTSTQPLKKAAKDYIHLFKLGDRPEGKYSFQLTEDGLAQKEDKFYISDFFWSNRPLAVIDIHSGQLNYTRNRTYNIRFQAKSPLWVYKVNLTQDYSGSSIEIKDNREPSELIFKKVGNINQSKGKTLVFRPYDINEPVKKKRIALSEMPLDIFSLTIEKNGKITEIKGLPNPSIQQVKSEMHINI